MTTKKLLLIFAWVFAVLRSIMLMRRKEYRLFPLWFLIFALGAATVSNGIRRNMKADDLLRPTRKYGGQAWYQDVAAGVFFATLAIVGCGAYIESKRTEERFQPRQRRRRRKIG